MTGSEHNPFLQPSAETLRIERRAWRVLRGCAARLGLESIPLPIPIDAWIERPLDIRFGIADLTYLGPGVLGAAFLKDREILVSEQTLTNDGRFRFTCAHELGHMLLHRNMSQAFRDTDRCPPMTATKADETEWQADRFAAAFLMPFPIVLSEMHRVAQAARLDVKRCVPSSFVESPESEWLWRHRFLPSLTKTFAVSVTALLRRFDDLLLIDGQPFLPPRLRSSLLRPAAAGSSRFFEIVAGFPARQAALFDLD